MNDAEVAARGQRAEQAWEEFVQPEIEGYLNHLQDRMDAVALNELDSRILADKLSRLATAKKVAQEIAKGIQIAIKDGQYAQSKLVTVSKIESMTAPKQRMINIAPSRY